MLVLSVLSMIRRLIIAYSLHVVGCRGSMKESLYRPFLYLIKVSTSMHSTRNNEATNAWIPSGWDGCQV